MVTHISKSPEETYALGRTMAVNLRAGDVVGLVGDLGSGKTQFVKGIAAGLGVTENVHSPTFTLVNQYSSGHMPCYHLDLYRLETPEQIIGAGLQEYIPPADGVTLVEWYDRWPASFPQPASGTLVRLIGATETERLISYEPFGA